MDRPSQNGHTGPSTDPDTGKVRSNFSNAVEAEATIRAVTPDPNPNGAAPDDSGAATAAVDPAVAPQSNRGFGAISPSQSSPRSIPGGERRRQGIVFSDASFEESFDSSSSSPPLGQSSQSALHPPQSPKSSLRPRTHTVDGALALRQQQLPPSASFETRHRVGSLSSTGSQPYTDVDTRTPPLSRESIGFSASASAKPPDLKINSSSGKEKKITNRRLIKRATSRPTSPLVSPPPSVDSLPIPIPTDDATRLLLLMKTLCGRMRGEVEYQSDPGGAWYGPGICYIDEERGSLLFDGGQNGSIHIPLVGDLRGCRVVPVASPSEDGKRCLEVLNHKVGVEVLLKPLPEHEFDLWLASFLCWQQIRPSAVRPGPPSRTGSNSPIPTSRSETTRKRGSSATALTAAKDAAIIKVGKVMLWDKGVATSPWAVVKRPSTRDLRSGSASWSRVSSVLQDNGEFKLMTDNDATVLSIIELSQLSRRAVQQLDKTVLDEEYCIAIFPIYASTATHLSIFRPIYLALDSKVLFEVWFVLLRAYAVPDLYAIDSSTDEVVEVSEVSDDFHGQLFRLEKTVDVRVTEAKLRRMNQSAESCHPPGRDRDPLVGNYHAEVILDGEIRARTTTQTDTKSPFWRDTAQFTDLPAVLPPLSIILKRVDGNMESFSHQLQASLGLPKTGNLTEVIVGSVDIPLDKLEKRKDHEQWHSVYGEKNESIGQMFAKVCHDELVVLPSEDYQPLSDLLHKYSASLTLQITLSMPPQLRRLAETFINIFQVSGFSSQWFMALVEEEIDGLGNPNSVKRLRFSRRLKSNDSTASASDREQIVRDMGKSLAGEANLLFRGNTLLTQALEFHMRRLGQEYLESVLSDKVFEINEVNPDCEVDPSKVTRPEELEQHWMSLIQWTTEVWECISLSASNVAPEIRRIFKYVRAVADDRYGDFLRTVSYTSVSGFLFLRFLCPAILNPKLFGLLRDHPRPRAQRTLTLIAKGLQALANLSSFGKKESWMEPMNKFVATNKQPFKNFIDQLCNIPQEGNLVATPASYSTPLQIMNRLSPTAREGFPSLPHLIDQSRNFAALVTLWLEGNKSSSTENHPGFDGELGEFHKICETLQKRSDECAQKIEAARPTESHHDIADDVAESLEKASLLDSTNLYQGYSSWETDPYRGGNSSGSETGDPERHKIRNYKPNKSSDSGEKSGTLRSKGRDGRNPRSFLSGLIGKGREKALSPSSVREKSRDKEEKGGRGMLGFTEAWQGETSSRH